MKTYANGVLVHTYNGSGAIGDTDSPNNEFQIGGRQGVTTVISKFQGQIDEVRVWNVAKTKQEIQENMNRQLTGTQAGLVGYWSFDQVNAGTVLDLSGNKNNGQLVNGAKLTDFAKLDVSNREFQVNTTTKGDHEDGSVTGLSNGGFVVTWTSSQNGDTDVYGQVFDGNGNKIGSTEFLVNTTTILQYSASVKALSNGGFVVTWNSYQNSGDVYGQIFDANGNKVGNTQFLVNTTTNGSKTGASVTALSNGGFVITWNYYQNGFAVDYYAVFGQVFDANGNKVGNTEFLVNTTTNGSKTGASVTALSNGGFVVTWQSSQNDGDVVRVSQLT